MRRVAIVLVLVLLGACGGKKPDPAKAEAACKHAIELGFWEAAAMHGKEDDPEAKALVADQMKGPIIKDQIEKCTKDAESDSTPEQVDCILAAKAGADIDKSK